MTLSSPLTALACSTLLLLSACTGTPYTAPLAPAYLDSPAYTVYAAGDIADCRQRGWQYTGAALTAELIAGELARQPDAAVLSLGDHTYPAGLAAENEASHTLAEFGVVFLMFSIGLEFSLPKFLAMRRIVFGLGMAQVVTTIVATVVFGWFVGRYLSAYFQVVVAGPVFEQVAQ